MTLGHRLLEGRSGHEVGRELLGEMYAQYVGGALPDILIGQRGKPYFATGSIHFSITHTKNHVFCALSNQEIGIDAEELDRAVKPSLAQKILSPGELRQYEQAGDKQKALLTFWVLKEAAAKMTGQGIWGNLTRTDFSLDDPRVTEMNGCIIAVICNGK